MTTRRTSDVPPRPDSVEVADGAESCRSLYVHMPFCRRRCPYCDFAVVALDETRTSHDGYVDAVVAELAMTDAWGPLDAVNFGGGTPSATPPDRLGRIMAAMEDRFGVADGAEVSLEANPEDVTAEVAATWVALGINRVSLGVQSFDDTVLAWLGREHDGSGARKAVAALRAGGIASVGVDLIFGSAVETPESWRNSVATALECGIDHLSTYALTVERGTALSRAVAAGAPAPDPDAQADAYEHVVASATAGGLVHYEVSNFSRPGHQVRYNLGTWAQGEYEAVGLGAHGHRGGARYRNVRRLDAYLAAIADGRRPRAGFEKVEGHAAEVERLVLGIRRRAGVAPRELHTALESLPSLQRLIDAGLAELSADRLVATVPLLTDEVARALLDIAAV